MKKTAQAESQKKRNTIFSRLEIYRRCRHSATTQQHNSISIGGFQEVKIPDARPRLSEGITSKSPEGSDEIVFPPFPSELLNSTPEDFILPDEYLMDHKNEENYPELMSLSPNPNVKVPCRKANVNESDLADTIPIQDIASSLLKMSPEKPNCNLLDTRAVSPILLRKPAIARSHLYSRRMKSLNSSVRLKRSIPKQIPLVLDHEVMTKINENLPDLTQIDDWRKEQDVSVSSLNDADKGNDFFHEERILQLSTFESHTLKTSNGGILAAFCEHEVIIVVQDSLVTFLTVNNQPDNTKNGKVDRIEILSSVNRIFTSNVSTDGSICACMEMVSQTSGEEQQLMVLVYTFNQSTAISSTYSIYLLKLPKHVNNIKICPVCDCAFVTCWFKGSDSSTQILKYSLDEKFQAILKSTELSAVNGWVNSLHTLRGCQKVILGETISAVTIWDLHSGHIMKILHFEGLMWRSYLWCNEDKGFLFSAVTTDKDIQITAANLTNGKFKVLRKYSVPESFSQSSGLHVAHGLVIATYPEGFVVWELASSKIIQKVITKQLFLSKGRIICVTLNGDMGDIVLRVLDVTKLQ